ncbi:hypothetical protein BDV95DRAFT_146937 [Massariosphaeria phaeospora]|uniref:Peptidase C14 caspase domain-containing protein n=1 Tax=Massariosphaeria phaeospora TaxID=100035 RepID=A0A7C8ILS3_9PLEO|nr:hypothetical protein BDV95DRAFT_146937 [Massariosphaeria phaeospora]
MATQQCILSEPNPAGTGEGPTASMIHNEARLTTATIGRDTEECVILPNDTEKKKESERQALFQNAVSEALDIPTGYLKVAVLVVRWHEEVDAFQKGHDEEIGKLRKLFHDRFHYEFEETKLDTSKKPQNTLNAAIAQHVASHDGPNNLLIVYYTGHGRLTEPANGEKRLVISATSGKQSNKKGRYPATAFWDIAEKPLLESAEADVLAILDSCYSSNAHEGYHEENRAYELLAACPRDGTTVAPGPNSFTTALIKSLKELLNEYENRNFTTTKLLEKLNMNRKIPAQLWDQLDKHQRHVQLAPLDKRSLEAKAKSFQTRAPEQAWVKLRFSLEEPQLELVQIENFAHQLVAACERAEIPVRRIDWIKMESASSTLAGLVTLWRRKSLRSNSGSYPEVSRTLKRQNLSDASSACVKRRSLSITVQTPDETGLASPAMVSPISVVISESPSD